MRYPNVRDEEEVSVKLLTRDEFQRLLGALDQSDLWSVRNYWMLILFVHTALRVSEMAGLQIGDVFHDGQPRARLHLRAEIAKGHRDDGVVALNAKAREAITQIVAFNQRYGFSAAPGAPLLTTRRHTHISARSIQALVKELRERAGLDVRATPHCLRHSSLSWLASRANLSVVQQQARHRHLDTLRLYVHPSPEEVAAAVELLV